MAIGRSVMRQIVLAAIFVALAGSTYAEKATTDDGRIVELNADGTYKFIVDVAAPTILMTEQKPFFEPFAGEYGQNSVRFMPIFMNETGKTIVGFKFKSVFKSAFGDEVFAFEGESSEKVAAAKESTAAIFYYFEDNQFIPNEPYDKLSIFVGSGTGTIATTISAVVFEDGSVIKSNP